jgi:hypothetical protein
MTQTITLTLSEDEALAVLYALRKVRPTGGKTVVEQLKDQLPDRPLIARCYHCRATFTVQDTMTQHLIEIHNYVDDPYGEDTAQTNSGNAFQRAKERAK